MHFLHCHPHLSLFLLWLAPFPLLFCCSLPPEAMGVDSRLPSCTPPSQPVKKWAAEAAVTALESSASGIWQPLLKTRVVVANPGIQH